jgi:hypothetical protein
MQRGQEEPKLRYIYISAHGQQETIAENINGKRVVSLKQLIVPRNCFIITGCKTNVCMYGVKENDTKIINIINNTRKSTLQQRDIILNVIQELNTDKQNMWCCFEGLFPEMQFSSDIQNRNFLAAVHLFLDKNDENKRMMKQITENLMLSKVFKYISSNPRHKYILVILACRNNYQKRETFGLMSNAVDENVSTIGRCFSNKDGNVASMFLNDDDKSDDKNKNFASMFSNDDDKDKRRKWMLDDTDTDDDNIVQPATSPNAWKGGKAKTTKWVSTGKTITDKKGKKRTLYECSDKPGELRIRKFVMVKGERRVKYIKCGQKP